MFVNLLELLRFVYLIKYCFIKWEAGSCWGQGARSALPSGGLPAGHPACSWVCLMHRATHDCSPLHSGAVCFSSIL